MYRFAIWEILKTEILAIRWICSGGFKAKTEAEAMDKIRKAWKECPQICKEIRCVKDGKIFFHFNNSKECFNIERETYKKGQRWTI
jgi:hypothetical protein